MTWLHRTKCSLLRGLHFSRFRRFPLAGELIVTIVLGVFSAHGWAQPVSTTAGERVYREGILPSEATLWGQRQAGARIGGADAACVSYHRRSGLGSAEGSFTIPPIIGTYLFRTRAQHVQDLDLPHVPAGGAHRDAYTDEHLARAIRDGVRPAGTELSYLMPRFKLDSTRIRQRCAADRQRRRIHLVAAARGPRIPARRSTQRLDPFRFGASRRPGECG